MALFKKKSAGAPAAPVSASPDNTSTAQDDFSDFSPDALQTSAAPANGKSRGRAKRAAAPKASPKGFKNGIYIGLNIGSDLIKVVEIQAKNGELSITGMSVVPTPPESISNGVVMSVNALAGSIRDALNQAGIKSKRVVTSVSGTGALVVRIIEVPKMSDGELEDNMKMDADRYIPFPPSEVIMDFKALRDLPSDPDAMNMEVLLAAAQREIIDLHVQVLQDARLDPRAIDVEPLAAARALSYLPGTPDADYGDVSAILNVGASGTEISILRGDILVFTRTVPTGGNSMTQAIVDTLGLAWSDAEELKRDMGDALAPGATPARAAAPVAHSDFDLGAGQDADGGDDWTEFGLDTPAGEAAPVAGAGEEAFIEAAAPAAPASTDPFDDAFFDQGPQNAEPGEQHQQKEGEPEPIDPESKNLPSRDGGLSSTEDIFGSLNVPAQDEESLLPSIEEPPPAPAQPAAPARGNAGMPSELRALFNFEEVEDPDEELPTVEEGKPMNFNSLLGEEEDDLTDLPTLVADAPPATPMASAFDFPVLPATTASAAGAAAAAVPELSSDEELPERHGALAATESISGTTQINAEEASLLPSEAAGHTPDAPTTQPFSLADDPFAAPPAAAPPAPASDFSFEFESPAAATAPETPAPAPVAEDPFAAFDLSGAAPGTPAPAPAAAEPVVAAAAAAPVAGDDLDLDSLFGGAPVETTPVAAPDATVTAPLGDILGGDDDLTAGLGDAFGADDFGTDFSSFGAGLGGGTSAEIDAATLHGVISPVLEALVAEVRRSLEYHTTRYPDAAIRRITLVGGGAKLTNMDAYFTQSLGIPTSVGNAAARLTLRSSRLSPDYVDENGTLFTVAIGLAMRELMR